MVQEFIPSTNATSPRKRPIGVSERATIVKLTHYIQNLNYKLSQANYSPLIRISDEELRIIKEAIEATICHSGLFEYSLYQSDLYNKPDLSLVAKIIAIADLGTLGMDGVEAYIREGILIFLEDNLDIAEFLHNPNNSQVLPVNLKARILKATCFMVNFARERKERFEQELNSFQREIQTILQEKLFNQLNQNNIENIVSLVPTEQHITLEELLVFITHWNYFNN